MSIAETLASLSASFKAEQWKIHETMMWSWSSFIAVGLLCLMLGTLLMALIYRKDIRNGQAKWFFTMIWAITPAAFFVSYFFSQWGFPYQNMYVEEARRQPPVVEQCHSLTQTIASGDVRFLPYGDWNQVHKICGKEMMLAAMNTETSQLVIGPAPARPAHPGRR